MTKINNDELIDFLNNMIDEELEKPMDKQDINYVNACVDFIMVMKGISHEQIREELSKKHDGSCIENKKTNKQNTLRKRLILIACAVICLITLSLSMVGLSQESFIVKLGIEVLNLKTGESIEKDDITFTHYGQVKTYKDIKDFIKDEKLDIVYPDLPDDIIITNIRRTDIDNGENYIFEFSSKDIGYNIYNYKTIQNDIPDYYEIYIKYDTEFYILYKEFDGHIAFFKYKNYSYTITSYNYDTLIQMIDNLKGF